MAKLARLAVLVLAASVLIACETMPTAPVPTSGSAQIDCRAVLAMTPPDAASYVEQQGFRVSWRRVTTSDEGAVSEIVTDPPDGVITDIVTEGEEVIIFVTPEDDPLLEEQPIGEGCPGFTSASPS